jgi:Fe-S-cluster containining protein
MAAAPETSDVLRFACTSCGACCNRSPEVQLSEAAALSDMFVFRLMFRLYELPRTPAARPASRPTSESATFHGSKRLLTTFAARTHIVKRREGAKTVEYRRHLLISALTLDTGAGACTALREGRCSIYDRRPLGCRTLPFHYSRPEASARSDLEAFVGRPGHDCDTGRGAPVVLEQGRIVDPGSSRAREAALHLRARDRRWQDAILRRLKTGSGASLPSLREIEANAAVGATTISMRVAWQVAAEAGVIGADECRALVAAQAVVIDRDLAASTCSPDARQTLTEMRSEYRLALRT